MYLLDIWTFITNLLLGHLKTSWTKRSCHHFLSTITFSSSFCWFHHWLIMCHLKKKEEKNGNTFSVCNGFEFLNINLFRTSTKFPTYSSSKDTHKSITISAPRTACLSPWFPPKPKPPKKSL